MCILCKLVPKQKISSDLNFPLKMFILPSLCNLLLKMFSFLFIQILHNYYSHIEDLHLLFCAHFINIFLILKVLNLDLFPSKNANVVSGFC